MKQQFKKIHCLEFDKPADEIHDKVADITCNILNSFCREELECEDDAFVVDRYESDDKILIAFRPVNLDKPMPKNER